MRVTGNQAVNLLWMHYCDPMSQLELKETEVKFLELEVVYQYGDIEPSLVEKLIHEGRDDLIDYLRNNSCKSIFKVNYG